MRRHPNRPRTLGGLALVLGVCLAAGAAAYGQLRLPMTNYRSTITVDHPVAYYEHELRAGDTLFFHIEVTGPPVEMEVQRESASAADTIVLRYSVDRWAIVPFPVPATGVYSVAFATTCPECGPTLVRAQVDQAMGSIGVLPLPFTVLAGAALGAAGGAVRAVHRDLPRSR